MRAWQGRLLAATAMLASLQCLASEAPRRMQFSAPVSVAVDGTASVGVVEGVEGELAAIVERELAGLPYVPAAGDAGPVASTVLADGDVVLVPSDDAFDVVLEGLATQPRLQAWRPADYPLDMLRDREDDAIMLVLQVGTDGRVAGSEVVAGDSEALVAAAREAVQDWRFEPSAIAHEVGAPFWFHGNWSPVEVPDLACTTAARLAHLPGDDGCLRISETTGDVRRRGHDGAFTPHLVRPPVQRSTGAQRKAGH